MNRILLAAIFIAVLTACNQKSVNTSADADKIFDTFKERFVEKLWEVNPGWATSQGYHKYDSVLVIPGPEEDKLVLAFADSVDTWLQQWKPEALSAANKTDWQLIKNYAEYTRFYINEFKGGEWNPSNYNVGGAIFDVMDNRNAALDTKLKAVNSKLKNVPAFFEAAKGIIHNPTKEHTQLAIDQNKGSLYFFTAVLPDSLKASGLAATEKEEMTKNIAAAKQAVEGYISWLEKEVQPKLGDSARSFRIGKELYEKKFKLDVNSQYSAAEMYKKAEERKAYLTAEMGKLTEQLWPKYLGKTKMPQDKAVAIRMMIDEISKQHCNRDSFLPTIEKQLPQLTAFINSHNIIDLDSTKPLKVRKTPEYMEGGGAGASINSPGPYDKDAATYYNVSLLNGYSAEEAESYLREYNDYVLQILNIHEAIPGHYTQLIYSNRSPSIIKSIFGNGAMVEGWACYVERMMMEEGYNDSPEMWLFYYKWNMREACNFILDYNIHCNNWSEQQVKDLLVKEAFQQEAEAKGKYKRATLTQVQLTSYFTGLTEIYELREEIKKKQAEKFDLKKFHEQFLSYGSAPVKDIRALMLNGN
ncbi:MAG: DUF885 domain-containing protein [Chitinophagales bacterium]